MFLFKKKTGGLFFFLKQTVFLNPAFQSLD